MSDFLNDDNSQALQELKTLRTQFTAKRMLRSELRERPDLLWHYTSAQGLLSILESGQLWATHIEYLNDPQEMVYGRELVESVIEKRIRGTNDSLRDLFTMAVFGLRLMSAASDVYASCFCSEGNLLTQWRAYASEGKGFCVGFRPAELVLAAKQPDGSWEAESWPKSWYLTQVEYEREIQQAETEEAIDAVYKWVEKWSSIEPSNLLYRAGANAALSDIVNYSLSRFKHDAFASEKEWRYVYHRFGMLGLPKTFHPEIRVSAENQLIPYVPLSPRDMSPHLPIAKIFLGPRAHLAMTKKALGFALERFGYVNVDIEELPYTLRP